MTKALVVDDERKMRRVLQILLERMHVESVAAENAPDAIAAFEREQIDVVLTDLRMPGPSGLDLLTRLPLRHPDFEGAELVSFGRGERFGNGFQGGGGLTCGGCHR